jgi:indolepyruvate ferredoxin oxidoreductase beta subunit
VTIVARGTMVCATTRIAPAAVLCGEQEYPEGVEVEAARRGVRLFLVAAEELARRAGVARAANVALLGAASAVLPFGDEAWAEALRDVLPARLLAVNEAAFALGREAGPAAEPVS